MALLDMSRKKYDVSVAHVNYHKRKTANRDENIVKEYCLKYNIPFYKKDYKDDNNKGNFQDKARVFRYDFFSTLIKKHNLNCVLVAHHKDDLIETYLLQKKRNSEVNYYGLKSSTEVKGAKIKRPLLRYTKKQLEDYCLKNSIGYGIDESNLTDHYSRNKIRHNVVEKMSLKEKNELVKYINELNRKQNKEIAEAKTFLNKRTKIDVNEFLSYENPNRLLRLFIDINITSKQCTDLLRQIKEAESFETLIKGKYLCKEYGYLEVYEKEKDYSYKLNKIAYIRNKHFKLSKKGNSKQGVTLSKEDFPITIRNYKEGDFILMRYGTKKINRFFIDNKISARQRKMWPVMINKNGSAILVPEIGCDKHHYSLKHSLYMIEL